MRVSFFNLQQSLILVVEPIAVIVEEQEDVTVSVEEQESITITIEEQDEIIVTVSEETPSEGQQENPGGGGYGDGVDVN